MSREKIAAAAILGMLVSACVVDGWLRLSDKDGTTVYIDPKSTKRDGHFTKVWVLVDREQRYAPGVMSNRWYMEFDCKEGRHRVLQGSSHSESMARGETVTFFSQPGEWNDTVPTNLAGFLSKVVC